MLDSSWSFAIEDSKLPNNGILTVFPKGVSILLIKKAKKIYAVSNKCAHMACALSGGTLEGYTLKCPCHDWKFDIRTGEFLSAKEIKIPTYQLKVSDGKIYLKI